MIFIMTYEAYIYKKELHVIHFFVVYKLGISNLPKPFQFIMLSTTYNNLLFTPIGSLLGGREECEVK